MGAGARLPPALGQIARINTAQGACQAAIDRLRPLASASDDPAYAASLARALTTAGRHQEAGQWQASVPARYDELPAATQRPTPTT